MNDIALVYASLKSRALPSILSVFLTGFGFMLALLILMFGHHIQKRLSADGQAVDLVVGAKGSPLQLILSSVYHVDLPVGNIPYDEAKRWMRHQQVKQAVPLALGDNWHGYRIVGTSTDYLSLYSAGVQEGRAWQKPFEAVAGADTGLRMGQEFSGAHGLLEGGRVHEDEHYTIVGRLKRTGSVLDRLILTSVESVLDLHGQHEHEGGAHENHHEHGDHEEEGEAVDDHHEHGDHQEEDEHDAHEGHEEKMTPEITAVLLTVKSPIALMNLPHMINRESSLQAANPAIEMVRLTSMLGLGSKTFAALSFLLIAIASLSIFAGLAGSLENRSGELALLRALGYSRRRVSGLILAEGLLLTIAGLALGFVLGACAFRFFSTLSQPLSESHAVFDLTAPGLATVVIFIILAGVLSALIPALKAGRVDISAQLAKA